MGVMMGGCGMIPKVCKILGLIWYRPKQKHEKENGKRKLKPKMGNENGNQYCNYNKKGKYENGVLIDSESLNEDLQNTMLFNQIKLELW